MVESISDWANDKARENPGCVERYYLFLKNETIWKMSKWIMCKHHRNKENHIFVESSQHFLHRHIHPIYYFLYLGIANQDSFRITALVHRKITTSSGLFARPTRLARQWTACPTLPWVWPSESKYTQIQKYTKTKWIKTLIFCNSHEPQPCGSSVTTFIRYLYV